MIDWGTKSPATDPNYVEVPTFKLEKGPEGKNGIAAVRFAPLHTHKIGDPKWRGPDGAQLQFQVYVRAARKVSINLFEKESAKGSKTYVASLSLKPGDGWQTVTLSAKDFKTVKGEAPTNWRKIQTLDIEAEHQAGPSVIYSGFRWVKP